RTLLSPYFSGGRVSAMEPWMGEIIDERVAVLAGKHPPIDMEATYAEPVVMAMICALLGVPEEERETFAGHAYASFDPSDAEGEIAGGDLFGYLVGLVARLREKPGDNVLSGLAQTGLDDVQATSMGLLLLHAAYGATVT